MNRRGQRRENLISTTKALEEIHSLVSGGSELSVSQCREWLASDDLRIGQASLDALIEFNARFNASLLREVASYVHTYFERAFLLIESASDTKFGHSLGRSFCAWFTMVASGEVFPAGTLSELKALLEMLCRRGNKSLSLMILCDVLEPLCESRRVALLFADWDDDPALRPLLEKAIEWGQGFWPRP
ncbi:MAG: hypothetical protein ACRD50_06070 [Candidatus Acidiferrales bacterium]